MSLPDSRLSDRQAHHRLNPTLMTIMQYDCSAMRLNDGLGDSEAQTDAARIAAARSL